MSTVSLSAELISQSLERWKYNVTTEAELQSAVASALHVYSWPFREQVEIAPKDRIDFVVAFCIGVELKVKGSLAAVTRQLHRYALSDKIAALVLVTTVHRLARVPRLLNGKRVHVVSLRPGLR